MIKILFYLLFSINHNLEWKVVIYRIKIIKDQLFLIANIIFLQVSLWESKSLHALFVTCLFLIIYVRKDNDYLSNFVCLGCTLSLFTNNPLAIYPGVWGGVV